MTTQARPISKDEPRERDKTPNGGIRRWGTENKWLKDPDATDPTHTLCTLPVK